jgi:nucleoside-diphosphate-sugar epimerase
MDLSLYGATGILGSYFNGLFPSACIPREQLEPDTENVLYLISTTDNATFKENPHIDIDTNLVQLMRRLEACRKTDVEVFNFVSSWFVYGPYHSYPDETAICNPNGFYSTTKYTAEKLVKEYCQVFGIGYRIFRLGNVYGGPDSGNIKRNALHYLINKIKNHEDIEVYINVSRDFIHILDVCRALDFLCEHGDVNTIYNIGTGLSTRLGDALDQAQHLVRSRGCVLRKNVPPIYDQAVRFALNCGKLKSHGFTPLILFEEGLRDLCLNQKFCTPDRTLMEQRLKQQLPT